MDLSGIIFVVLAAAWALYLIPKVLKHHDEVARTRSIDRFSTAMRVLARREPVNRRDARLVVTPARPVASRRLIVPTPAVPAASLGTAPGVSSSAGTGRPPLVVRRAATKAAARRRRRILSVLLLSDLVVVGLAAFAIVAWWSVAIPTSLTVLYLVLCRTQVRREDDASWSRDILEESEGTLAPSRAIRVEAAYGIARDRNDQGFEEVSPDEDTISISTAELRAAVGDPFGYAGEVETIVVSAALVDGDSLWDPLPVTLPTYVGKARASRTVRTIDLNEPNTWSSGRSEADSQLVLDAATAAEAATSGQDAQRAVGS